MISLSLRAISCNRYLNGVKCFIAAIFAIHRNPARVMVVTAMVRNAICGRVAVLLTETNTSSKCTRKDNWRNVLVVQSHYMPTMLLLMGLEIQVHGIIQRHAH
jgi:hypothetical protein